MCMTESGGYGNQDPELKVNYHPQILSREKVEHDKGKKGGKGWTTVPLIPLNVS